MAPLEKIHNGIKPQNPTLKSVPITALAQNQSHWINGSTNLQSQSNESSEAILESAKSTLYYFKSITIFNQLI
jgi:hypothetical protein